MHIGAVPVNSVQSSSEFVQQKAADGQMVNPIFHSVSISVETDHRESAKNLIGAQDSGDNLQKLEQKLEKANRMLASSEKYITREIHPITHSVMFQLKDKQTQEVIREFPSRKVEDLVAKLCEAAGIFVDERI